MISKFINRLFFKSRGQKAFSTYLEKASKSEVFKSYCERIHGVPHACFNMLSKDQYQLFLNSLEENKKEEIMDLGCGLGTMALELQKKFKSNVDACDFAFRYIRKIENNAKVNFFFSDLDSLKLKKEKYDLIYCIDSFYFLNNYPKILNKIKSSLKEDGKFILFHSFSAENDIFNLEANALYKELKKRNAEFEDVTNYDLNYWQENKTLLEQMESDFFENSSGDLWKVKSKECSRFLDLHKKNHIKRFMITL